MISKIQVTVGGTINLGNYENVKLEYVVEVLCELDITTYRQTIDTLQKELEERFLTSREELTKKK